jgi:hypothetical protein
MTTYYVTAANACAWQTLAVSADTKEAALERIRHHLAVDAGQREYEDDEWEAAKALWEYQVADFNAGLGPDPGPSPDRDEFRYLADMRGVEESEETHAPIEGVVFVDSGRNG